jgi:hypothetical protein
MKTKDLKVLEMAINNGIDAGMNSAFKHNDAPTRGAVANAIHLQIMQQMDEWFFFDQDKEFVPDED